MTNDSKADVRRRRWSRKHKAHVRTLERQITRRPPHSFVTVWVVDWISHDGSEIVCWCDWGETTRRKAIDKSIAEEHGRRTGWVR